ncbi:WD40 repeat-like protein, partial [Gymnopus androsaceus JB14]
SVAFSPDGTRIVSGSDDKTIRIWDAANGVQIGEPLEGHEYSVRSVAFSPDGTKIVSGSPDNTIRLMNHYESFQGSIPICSVHNCDGWIIFPHLPHGIIWIPPQFRKMLWRPHNICIIS